MKKLIFILSILIVTFLASAGCDNIQQNVEDKARQIQESANKKVDEHLTKIDSSLNQLDTAFQQTLNKQLEKADTIIDRLQETN